MTEPTSSDPIRGVAFVPGRHWVSPVNFQPEVTESFDFPKPFAMIDSTIRKVIYTAGVLPSESDLLKICEILIELGVKDESLNIWWWGEAEPESFEYNAFRAIARAGFDWRLNVFTDTLVGDGRTPMALMKSTIDMLAEAGAHRVSPGLLQPPDPAAERRQAEQFQELADHAGAAGLEFTLTVAHCARRDFDSLVAGTNAAIAAGVKRIDLMDSTSALSPEAMKVFLRAYRSRLSEPVPITMHHHDDFGMATAGTVAAVTAGASPDVALNGVSYRSGFAALEEVVLALDVLYGLDTGIKLDRLQWASDELARIMDLPVPPLKPVVGRHQFLRDIPPEVLSIAGSPARSNQFPPSGCSIDPALVGASMRWVWGKQSSDATVYALASAFGITLADGSGSRIRAALNDRLAAIEHYPKWLEPEEVEAVIREMAVREDG